MAHMKEYFQDPKGATFFFWQEIAAIMKSGNETMFGSSAHSRSIIHSGEYRKLIHVYQPLLQNWYDEFNRCNQSEQCISRVFFQCTNLT